MFHNEIHPKPTPRKPLHINPRNANQPKKAANSRIPYVNANSVIETFKLMILLNKKENMTDEAFAEY
jgi:hypothetical protein